MTAAVPPAREALGATSAVEVSGIWKTYEEESVSPVRALRGVDLTVRPGEFVAIVGPSGCGKSTLLNVIAGLDRPSEGRVSLAGQCLNDKSDDDLARLRRRHLGFVHQTFELLEGMSALENVALPAVIAGKTRVAARVRGLELLDLLGLSGRARHLPGALSGGERQRLAIARAMANEPTVLLADEPTGALDSAGAAEIVGLFRRLHEDGQTILLVTHDADVAATASRIVAMRDGRIESSPTVSRDRVAIDRA
jgi:putative ABC transport system ATP-binding protein